MVIKECVNGAARNSPPKPSGQGSVQTDAARLHTSITRGLNLSQISIWKQVSEKSQTMGRRKDTLCPLRAYTRSFRRTRCHHASSEARPTTACHMSQGSSPRERRNPSRKSQNGTPARRS